MSAPSCTLFVCVSCRVGDAAEADGERRPGRDLYEALIDAPPGDGVAVAPVDCLAVCKRACTVAFTAPGKWTYVIGDIDPVQDGADVRAFAGAYAASENGIVAWRERPKPVRKGVIARTPPFDFRQPEAAE